MNIFFSTIVRNADISNGGEIVRLNWDEKRVEKSHLIVPENPEILDPNPRGNSRGGRGIAILPDGRIAVATYHSLYLFDSNLTTKEQYTHNLMVGLHEVFLSSEKVIWLTSTSIDAALEYNLGSGSVISQFWPREQPFFQQALNTKPLKINKKLDNRLRFLDSHHIKKTDHLHLNAVAAWKNDIYALFHAKGVVANLTRSEVVLQDDALIGAHNLIITSNEKIVVNGTYGRSVRIYDLSSGVLEDEIKLMNYKEVRRLVPLWYEFLYVLKGVWNRVGKFQTSNPLPYFVRGLDIYNGRLFVGISPATILEFDMDTKQLRGVFTYSQNLAYCIHGLKVVR